MPIHCTIAATVQSIDQSHLATSPIGSALPTAKAWLTTIFPLEEVTHPVYRRPPYQRHMDHVSQLQFVFQALQTDIPFGDLTLLSKRVHISRQMLLTWRQKVQGDSAWRPSRCAYAAPHRIFTDAQEKHLLQKICTEFFDKGLDHGDEAFRIDAL
jgi:hypothetical protein